MIELRGITKTFKVSKRDAGIINVAKNFFLREYEEVNAVDNISFKIKKGEMVGYIGPNGAGKSTTIKIMTGILHPDKGQCIVNNRYPWKNREEFVRHIGVVFGQRSQLWWDLPVVDSFIFLKELYSVSDYVFNKNIEMYDDMLGISELMYTPVRQLSLGQRMKCEIVSSLIHNPDVLFLDEPTIGLDAVSKNDIRELIKRINKENGTTVILTSHDMQDIVQIANRVIMIGKGKILLDMSVKDMISKYGQKKYFRISYDGELKLLPVGMKLIDKEDKYLIIEIDTELIKVKDAIKALIYQLEINDLQIDSIDLDKIICRLYEEYTI